MLLQIIGKDNKACKVEVEWLVNLKQFIITTTTKKPISTSDLQFIKDCILAEAQVLNGAGKINYLSIQDKECTCIVTIV